jgi:predicted O-methyltransferase YrrM
MTDPDPFTAEPPPWAAIRLRRMGLARQVPTMLSPEERRLYLWLGRDFAAGRGAIVDLGCFVGGSTAHLAEGNRRAALPVAVHAYDRFRVAAGLKQRMLYARGVEPFAGQDMLPTAIRLLAPWSPHVTLHRGLIERQAWTGGPIAVVVVDAAKSARVADAIAATFFPMVVPGGVIVQQDALHAPQPWVLAQMGALRPWCRPVAHAAPTTLVWQVVHPLDGTALRAARVARLSDATMTAAIEAQRTDLARFGVGRRLDAVLKALADNPGAREAKALRPTLPVERTD